MQRVLVIDDDVELCELVSEYLLPEGFLLEAVHDGVQGVSRALSGEHDFVVLDVMLPGLGGFEILRRIRAVSAIPVIMLTARGDEIDLIMGLEIGADDYLPKPFNPRELVARTRAIQRRVQALPAGEVSQRPLLAVDDVEMDVQSMTVRRFGAAVDLTSVEFGVLEILLQSAGSVVTREHLVRKALGRRLLPYDRSIDMHVSNLRRKLGAARDGSERIKTVRGVGYFYARVVGNGG
ncbi:MAG: response regulator transcription factor [Capsulimonas sp.]|uniref:response regulator transcription factor n=1 Tax=Capsulimonas sp. TaxID=2494211 RepID=UPI003265DE45